MKVSDEKRNSYTSIYAWTAEQFTVEEVPVTGWDWDYCNGLGWGIGSVDVGDSPSVFGGRMLYRHTGPEVVHEVRTATGKTAQLAVLRATTLAQCGLHAHNEQGEMWVARQMVIQEGPTQFRAYVLGAKNRKEGE